MAVTFLESWDFGTNHTDLAQFVHDYNQYWSINFDSVLVYSPGYSAGQSIQVENLTGTAVPIARANAGGMSIPNNGELRIHFWARLANTLVDTGYRPLIGITRGDFNDVSWSLEINGQGDARLAYGSFLEAGTQLSTPFQTALTNAWAYYELYINENTNEMSVYKNGTIFAQATSIPSGISGSSTAGLFVGRPNSSQLPQLDHIVVTTGESIHGVPVAAVAVGCAIEGGNGAQASGKGFCGHLVINGSSYRTTYQNQSVDATTDGPDGPDQNYAPSTYLLFPNDPSTSSSWTLAGANSISAWGVCYNDDTQTSRITSISLMKVVPDPVTGFPIITNTKAGAALYLSGPWTKTNSDLTYGGHLRDIPHPELRSEDEWLTINDNGCILFGPDRGGPTTFGITFAEEYREDFKDWDTVTEGITYDSYFVTGYTILGEGNKKFQTNYVTVNYEPVFNGGAYFQGVWDYATSGDTGRWSSKQQVYAPTGNYAHQMRRLKVRGHGKAIQIRLTSEDNKDFKINGWTAAVSSNQSV